MHLLWSAYENNVLRNLVYSTFDGVQQTMTLRILAFFLSKLMGGFGFFLSVKVTNYYNHSICL